MAAAGQATTGSPIGALFRPSPRRLDGGRTLARSED
jgi:hypothetical protein